MLALSLHAHPAATQPIALDSRYPGTWEILTTLPNGTYHLTYTVATDGYFTLVFERPTGDPLTDEGTLEAMNGNWAARSISNNATSQGHYKFPDANTLVTTTSLGVSTWTRTN